MRKIWIGAALLAWGLLGPGPVAGAKETDEPVIAGDLGVKLDAAAVSAAGNDFWGAVLVARDGKILLARGYGFADYAKTPNTPRTLFELASASKQVAAAAILHLQQRRKLSVTDTLDRFFKGVPPDKKAIRIHHLLTHTSGISGRVGVPYASRIQRKDYVAAMLAEPLIAKPGEKFQYCNVGYALLAAIVEKASRKSFEDYVEKYLFKPAKLADTGFIGDRDLIRSGRVSSRRTDEPGRWTAADWHWGWGYRGMGGVVTTVYDLLRWDRALRGDDILGAEAKRVLYTPVRSGYACGWKVTTTERGTTKVHHSGGVAGYGVNIVRYLEEDVCIFVLSNDGRAAHAVTGATAKLLFPPAKLTAVIDVTPYEARQPRIVNLPKAVTWEAKREKGGLVFRLIDGKHCAVEIRAPAAYAAKLIASLTQAIAAREAGDDGRPAHTEAGLYLQPYDPSRPRFDLDEQLTLEIRPEYRGQDEAGRPVIDRRVLLVLKDAKHGQWPLMAKLNVAAARSLLEVLREASE